AKRHRRRYAPLANEHESRSTKSRRAAATRSDQTKTASARDVRQDEKRRSPFDDSRPRPATLAIALFSSRALALHREREQSQRNLLDNKCYFSIPVCEPNSLQH